MSLNYPITKLPIYQMFLPLPLPPYVHPISPKVTQSHPRPGSPTRVLFAWWGGRLRRSAEGRNPPSVLVWLIAARRSLNANQQWVAIFAYPHPA